MLLRLSCFTVLCLIAICPLKADEAVVSNDEPEVPTTTAETESNKGSPQEGSLFMNPLLAFVQPPYGLYTEKKDFRLPAGKPSTVVISFANIHEGTSLPRFSLDLIESSLHYPGFFEYRIQNLTKSLLQNTLEPGHEGSIHYTFKPALELAGRPFDLCILAYYHDENGVVYSHSLFNQTVNMYEVEEGVDTELIFLWVLVAAVAIASLVGIWHWCSPKSVRKNNLHRASKTTNIKGDSTTENEYLTLLNQKKTVKPERSSTTVTRRQGKR